MLMLRGSFFGPILCGFCPLCPLLILHRVSVCRQHMSRLHCLDKRETIVSLGQKGGVFMGLDSLRVWFFKPTLCVRTYMRPFVPNVRVHCAKIRNLSVCLQQV